MKKQLLIFPTVIFFFTLLIFFYLLTIERDPSKLPSALIGKKIPIFETASLFDNKTFISTKQFGEETTLVNFFATWCMPCRNEHRYLKRLSNEKGIKIGIVGEINPQVLENFALRTPISLFDIDLDELMKR